jgi:hypothetical protein
VFDHGSDKLGPVLFDSREHAALKRIGLWLIYVIHAI